MNEVVEQPVARVAVDMPLLHLDRLFDYRVTAAQAATALPGVRVRVPFAGQQRDGFVVQRIDGDDLGPGTALHQLSELARVVSDERVLTAEIAGLVRAVADHWGGSFADVVRLAVPPRHAAAEGAEPPHRPPLDARRALAAPHPLGRYPAGAAFLDAIGLGGAPRAFWQVAPTPDPIGDWAAGLVAGAAAAVAAGRGAVLVVPDARDLARLAEACRVAFSDSGFVTLTAESGPAARYRSFLAALRGQARVVIGTRGAVWAPVEDLGFVGVWDEGDDLLGEPRAPYPHVREVAALRAQRAGAALMLAGHGRSTEAHALVERGWLHPIALSGHDQREVSAVVRTPRDRPDQLGRLPHDAFDVIRAGLAAGPVLIQVPRGGYQVVVACAQCHTQLRCSHCGGPLHGREDGLICGLCGARPEDWSCPECGATRWRAPVVGAERTAEELGRAFPQVPVRRSHAGHILDSVDDRGALVICTPGAEPPAEGGYAAAVLLDADTPLVRADLRAAEESLRRWLHVCALVRPGEDGGSVLVVGAAEHPAVQALIRLDPAGLASRELADRREAGFPPVTRLVVVEGDQVGVEGIAGRLLPPDDVEVWGPAPVLEPDGTLGDTWRLTVRAPLAEGAATVQAVRDVQSLRTAHKDPGAVRIVVDPLRIG
ncbi:primosome assembly protein PriA [Raineyella sp. LH-20]|uniref:primosomal protein N' family DNA-binding protein n=1 Tax=Raineyella sp. LH-20 TaxID=3081204 RepID=UPI0029555A9D|nr:primosome assembly protein PriA [Raineyella sp. LH-20]WOP18016.1 primosome assembly protein PriA [Raineyella sp. LH-20]